MRSVFRNKRVDERLVREAMAEWLSNDAGRRNGYRVDREYGSMDELARIIVEEVRGRCLTFPEISTSVRKEDGKDREIGVEDVKMQVCEYVVSVATDQLYRRLIGHWQLSRDGMGQFKAARRVQGWVRACKFHAHADVHHCYGTMRCDKVETKVGRYIGSDDVRYVLHAVLSAYPDGHLMIGSYLSMRLANMAMSFAYRELLGSASHRRGKRVRHVRHACMYADDVWVFGDSKTGLNKAVKGMKALMREAFGVEFKPYKVCRCDCEPADVAGIVVSRGKVVVRDKTFLRARRSLLRFRRNPGSLKLARRLVSYYGWLKNTCTFLFRRDSGVYAAVRDVNALIRGHDRNVRLMACRQ